MLDYAFDKFFSEGIAVTEDSQPHEGSGAERASDRSTSAAVDKPSDKGSSAAAILGIVWFGLMACVLYGLGGGLRANVGILLNPLAENSGLTYADLSLSIAVLQLMFGAVQPFFGILASRTSNRFVLCLGAVLIALGMIIAPFAKSLPMMILSIGVLFGAGGGAVSFGLVLASAMRVVGPKYAMMVSGMLNAASGMGSFALAPTIRALLDSLGLTATMTVLMVLALLLLPLAVYVTKSDKAAVAREKAEAEAKGEDTVSVKALFKEAFSNRTYRLLVAGFSTCGFHMVLIEAHLYSQFVTYGIDETSAAWAFSLYGIFTIGGALLSGFLSTRLNKGKLVAFYYGFRAVWVLAFIFLAPKTMVTCVIFIIGLGMTGDATVSPTSGLVHENFSLGKSATLIGFLFFVHQVGAFISSWLGGILLTSTGGYEAIWVLDAAVCTFAFIMSARIAPRKTAKR